jgi:hypothetical protein
MFKRKSRNTSWAAEHEKGRHGTVVVASAKDQKIMGSIAAGL